MFVLSKTNVWTELTNNIHHTKKRTKSHYQKSNNINHSSTGSDKKHTQQLNSIKESKIWNKVFKNGPSEICGRQILKNLKGYGLLKQTIHFKFFEGCLPQISSGPFSLSVTQVEVVQLN